MKQGPPEGTQGYDYLDGRVQCLSFQRMELGYAVYEIEYRFLVDHPENVVVAGGMELDEEGWLRDYSMTAYLIVRNGSIVGLRISDISPEYPLFWYELPDLSEEEKWQAMAQVAYAGAEEWMQLYQGYIGGTGECAFSREELAQAGYQAQTLPEQWKLVRGGGYPQNWERSSSTSPTPWRSVWWMKCSPGPMPPSCSMRERSISGMTYPAVRK